jgi:hypothetical protein
MGGARNVAGLQAKLGGTTVSLACAGTDVMRN